MCFLDPKELEYTRQHVQKLFRNIPTDYYDRYDYEDLQKIILEDRRIRMNFWVSKIIGKPTESFRNPLLVNPLEENEMKNIKGKNFTLTRTDPIKVKNEEELKLKSMIIKHPMFTKKMLTDHEINSKVQKLLSTNFYKVSELGDSVKTGIVSNMVLLRDYELESLKNLKLENVYEIEDDEDF